MSPLLTHLRYCGRELSHRYLTPHSIDVYVCWKIDDEDSSGFLGKGSMYITHPKNRALLYFAVAWYWLILIMMTSSNGKHFPRYWPFCEGNSPVTGEFPSQRTVTRSFVFFDLHLNNRLSKPSRRRWFETQSLPLWRPYDILHGYFNGIETIMWLHQ